MNPDNNWKETRATAEDLSKLLGVSVSAVEDFLVVLENLIVHKIVEALSSSDQSDSGEDREVSVELPYLGSLVVSILGKRESVSLSFCPRSSFYKKVRKACHMLESPLVSQLERVLGEKLLKMFEEGELE